MSPRSARYHWIKLCKTLYEKNQVCPELITTKMENNQSHKYGSNSTLFNIAMKFFSIIVMSFYLDLSCLYCCDKMPICNFNIYADESCDGDGGSFALPYKK